MADSLQGQYSKFKWKLKAETLRLWFDILKASNSEGQTPIWISLGTGKEYDIID